MRTLASLVTLALVACAADPSTTESSTTAPPTTTSPTLPSPTVTVHEITVPARFTTSHADTFYTGLLGDHVSVANEISYALAEGYPRKVTIDAPRVCLGKACDPVHWPRWETISQPSGDAAKVDLDASTGQLSVELLTEGTVTLQLDGKLNELAATPIQMQLTIRVRRIGGFAIEQQNQLTYGCQDSMVLPSGAAWDIPRVTCLDDAGEPFYPANALAPAAIVLRSEGALTLATETDQLVAAPGRVTASIDTELPVRGLRSFEVVGPEAVTSVEAAFYLSRTVESQGTFYEQWAPITEGASYAISQPGRSNTVEVMGGRATTTRGTLCASVPLAWFTSASSTPETCTARGALATLDGEAATTAGSVIAPGECRLTVSVAGSGQQGATSFTAAW